MIDYDYDISDLYDAKLDEITKEIDEEILKQKLIKEKQEIGWY